MTSITRKIDDIIQEYGSWENYQQSLNKDKMGQIQLEVGKTYEIRGPHSHVAPTEMKHVLICRDYGRKLNKFSVEGKNRRLYRNDGRVHLNRESPLDLVREVTVQTTKQE